MEISITIGIKVCSRIHFSLFLAGRILQSRRPWKPGGELHKVCVSILPTVLWECWRQRWFHSSGASVAAISPLLGLWNVHHLLHTYADWRTVPCTGLIHVMEHDILFTKNIFKSKSISQPKHACQCPLFLLSQHHSPVTPVTALCAEAREAAQKLLNHYVKVIIQ